MCNDTEEWWKISRGIDLAFQNWDGIWRILTWALGSLKNVHFNGLVLTKIYNVWPKKYRGVIFHDTKEWCQNDGKIKIQNNQIDQMQCENFILPLK